MGKALAERSKDESFAELRSIIVGPEQRELRALQEHVRDPAIQTRGVSTVLPDAIALRANDPQLTRALAPSIEDAITASVRRDPRPLADALFPVIGPAIRKAIAHTLSSMMETVNRSVEQSISWRAVQWRWTAFRTGKRYAEIVLLNTVQYRVEQVLLIHTETGLLLQHLSADAAANDDPDQLSAMLTALSDFSRDALKAGGGDSLDDVGYGELKITVVKGPHAYLACVVRGTVPHDVRVIFQDALESVHRQFGPELKAFRGDATPFERTRPILENCLVTQYRQPQRKGAYRKWLLAGAVLLLAVGAWLTLRVLERQRWERYVDRLNAEPGLMVVAHTRRDGKFHVTGLRDPLVKNDPETLAAEMGISKDMFDSRWETYQTLESSFVEARATSLLRPPAGVRLTFSSGSGTLTATGDAPERWIVDSERLGPAVAGVRRFVYEGAPRDLRLKASIEATSILFPKGLSTLVPSQEAALRQVADFVRELDDTLRARDRRAHVEVFGHTDSDGPDTLNGPLSAARANVVREALLRMRIDAVDVAGHGVGSTLPVAPGTSEPEKERNRRASFRVAFIERGAAGSPQP
jgi:outer membrane protein OmpA-like peptidoglycan-associated protein